MFINFWKSRISVKLTAKDFIDNKFEDSFDDGLARNLKRNLNVFDVHVRMNSVNITSFFFNHLYRIEGGFKKDRYESIKEKLKDGIFVLNLIKIK